ncbi:MAG: hypothetical protein WDA08_01160 [Weeksellaceae bacterium]
MGLITDIWFGLGNMFKWLFENTLTPIATSVNWILFFIGIGLLVWWLYQLYKLTGPEHEDDYRGW